MRVWVTRDEPADGPLHAALRALGLSPVHEPVVTRRTVSDAAEAISQLGPEDWLVLTSPYAIKAVAREPASVPRVAVVGEASRQVAEARGFHVELVSAGRDAGSLFAALRTRVSRGRVCYPRSALVEPPQAWDKVEVISPVLYETVPRDFDRTIVDRVDVVAVASPSAVTSIQRFAETDVDAGESLRRLRYASIGPTTSAALERAGLGLWVEAPGRSFQSLAKAIHDEGQRVVRP